VLFRVSGTGWVLGYPRGDHPRIPAPPCTEMASPRCTGRRITTIAESSDRSSMPTPTSTPRTATGAPFALAANRPLSAPRRVPAAVGRAGSRRCTRLRTKAILHPSRSCCCAAPTGPSRTTGGTAALRRTAETENRSSRARAGGRRSNWRKSGGSSRSTKRERGRCTPPAASPPRHPPAASRPIPPVAPCSDGRAVGVRRSSGQGGNHPHSTPVVTGARAARLVVHYCTRGSKCRAHAA
jgi:hypothetical protein